MFGKGIGHAKIAFTVFKVYGVDFVWHSAGANFIFFDSLLEIVDTNILPDIFGET